MQSLSSKISISTFTLLLIAAGGYCAQPATSAARSPAPLGLLRLQETTKPGQAPALAGNKFVVDDLAVRGAADVRKVKKEAVDVLVVGSGKEWSSPMRGSKTAVSFVAFQLYASQNTIIDIAGARLGITASTSPDSLQLMFDDSTTGTLQWKPFKVHLQLGKYNGSNLIAVPTLTVRLDPEAGVWDIFYGSRLLADNLPLIATKMDQRQFVVRAGSEGVWVSGLVMADENPLYQDDNANSIDDVFEREKRGGLLAANASLPDRKLIAQQWMDAQRRKAPPPLRVNRPSDDRTVASPPPRK